MAPPSSEHRTGAPCGKTEAARWPLARAARRMAYLTARETAATLLAAEKRLGCAADTQNRPSENEKAPSQRERLSTRYPRRSNIDLHVELEVHDVTILHHVFLAFLAQLTGFAATFLAAESDVSSKLAVSALMKPRSKSEWMTPAACGAFAPTGMVRRGFRFLRW